MTQPNFVFFMTDQLRRDALGCYGNTICRTPRLDQIAAAGMRFDNAFTVSPVCSPARASLQTGLYPHNHGLMINTHIAPAWSPGLAPDFPSFSQLLADAGYALDYVGKWHVHKTLDPTAYGYDSFVRDPGETVLDDATRIHIDFKNGDRQLVAATNRVDEKSSPLWTNTLIGIERIRERAKNEQPFMVRMDMLEPHFPCLPPEPYASMYAPEDIPPWENFADDLHDKPASHQRKLEEWNLKDKDWAWWAPVVAKYYGVVSQIDACVGAVIDAIEHAGIAENTIFVFCTDHGDAMGSHGHFEKAGTMYDEIFRIPLIIKGPPEVVATGTDSNFVRSLDLMPTFVEWGRAKVPVATDARSLAPLANGSGDPGWPDSVYCEHHGEVWGYQSQRMVRTARWKYVYDPHGTDELYDLANDPAEMVNRIDDPSTHQTREEMKARLLGWNDATNDMFQWRWVRASFPAPIAPD